MFEHKHVSGGSVARNLRTSTRISLPIKQAAFEPDDNVRGKTLRAN
jgi:hypothetical protein